MIDLDEFCDILKMFDVTEDGCVANDFNHISLDILNNLLPFYKKKMSLVSLFVYKKIVKLMIFYTITILKYFERIY